MIVFIIGVVILTMVNRICFKKFFETQKMKYYYAQKTAVSIMLLWLVLTMSTMEKGILLYAVGIADLLFAVPYIAGRLKTLYDYKLSDNTSAPHGIVFMFSIFNICFIFAGFSLFIYKVMPTAFYGVPEDVAPWKLTFEFVYYSFMTLMTATPNFTPISRWAELVTLIEVILFVLVISQVIANVSRDSKDKKNKTDSQETEKDKEEPIQGIAPEANNNNRAMSALKPKQKPKKKK